MIDVLLPFVTHMCNASLREGCLPISQRHTIITPILKKPSLDASVTSNYRPVSNLTFMSKVVERICGRSDVGLSLIQRADAGIAVSIPTVPLNGNCSTLRFQTSCWRPTPVQLHCSASFDTVDTGILVQRLQNTFGIGGTVLTWVASFLQSRTQQVRVGESKSVIGGVLSGIR